jgi:hypothetical protein
MTHGGTYLQFVENRCDDGIVYNTRKPANHLLGCRAVFQRVSPAVWSPVFQCSLNRNRHGSKATTISSSTVRRIRLRVSMLAAGWRYRRGRSVPGVKIPRRFWKVARAQFIPVIAIAAFPSSLLEWFRGLDLLSQLVALLRFLSQLNQRN